MACKSCGDPNFDSKYRCHACEVKVGKFQWCVITHGPTLLPDGNMCDEMVSFEDTNIELFDGKSEPRIIAKKGSEGFLTFKASVFTVGEIFPVDRNFGRELVGMGRKPSKWDIGYQLFPASKYKQAIALALSVQKEKTNLDLVEDKYVETVQLTERQQQVRAAEDPFKLVYGWIKQGTISLKESKALLGEVFKYEQGKSK